MLQLLRKIKNNQIIQPRIPWPQGAFLEKITLDIDGFTDELVFQCNV